MEHNIKLAFQSIQAPQTLRETTKQQVLADMEAHKGRRTTHRPLWAAAAACCALVLGAGGYLWFTPTAVISVDINPSLELEINRFDRVVSAVGYNQDGMDLVDSLHLLFLPYQQAVSSIVNSSPVQQCLAEEELMSIGVIPLQAGQGEEILSTLRQDTAQQPNLRCYALSLTDVSPAHSVGLSYGKYQAYLELSALSDAFTPEEVGQLTMKEIRTLLEELGGDTFTPGNSQAHAGSGAGQGGNGAHGNGPGYGWGKKQNQ